MNKTRDAGTVQDAGDIQELQVCDLLVIGGGINGAGIAADAAGRGLSVLLCDKSDLGSATSSASSKLIHGGLRYLETWQFRLVRESLAEREVLLKSAPHIVSPMRFRLPHHKELRPLWMIRAGLYLYDNLSKRVTLPASESLYFEETDGLHEQFLRGFEYSDCWVDDARLVVLNAMRARRHGATILTRTQCIGLRPVTRDSMSLWEVQLQDAVSSSTSQVLARCVVNAAGPWVSSLGNQICPQIPFKKIRLVKGSHIVVPRIHNGEQAYLLQNADGRVVFVIPYEEQFSLIGTTEQDFSGDPATASISEEEISYLLSVVGRYFKNAPAKADIKHHFAGVRPLIDDGVASATKVSRDYVLQLHREPAPLLTVYGGKITTYRKLAEAAMEQLSEVFPQMKPAWTAGSPLPGGNFSSRSELQHDLLQQFPWLDGLQVQNWVKRYGTLTYRMLEGVYAPEDMGRHIGHGLYECEVRYLHRWEWARTVEDILWRRSKLGLVFSEAEIDLLEEILSAMHTVYH